MPMAPKITQDGDHWTIGAMQFESQQAAELYLESRKKPSGAGAWATFRALPWYIKAVLITLALVAINMAAELLSPRPAPDSTQPSRAQALMAKSERVATLINLNGQLCARVIQIEHLYLDKYKVTCARYRDGVGTSTYDIDLKTGLAQ